MLGDTQYTFTRTTAAPNRNASRSKHRFITSTILEHGFVDFLTDHLPTTDTTKITPYIHRAFKAWADQALYQHRHDGTESIPQVIACVRKNLHDLGFVWEKEILKPRVKGTKAPTTTTNTKAPTTTTNTKESATAGA